MTTEYLIGTILISPLVGFFGLLVFVITFGMFGRVELKGTEVFFIVLIVALAFIGFRLSN